eukprot:TRINITY_DN17219_c0_g1_i2.p1 TRINITY_DN17219_c0_g1~~TRINITY_DN17219_c0_g1_i2.p1  ORF type:complete len:651 (+),score=198.65 TRINITY_DN17219_c0_g1_i2:155-1954(+)
MAQAADSGSEPAGSDDAMAAAEDADDKGDDEHALDFEDDQPPEAPAAEQAARAPAEKAAGEGAAKGEGAAEEGREPDEGAARQDETKSEGSRGQSVQSDADDTGARQAPRDLPEADDDDSIGHVETGADDDGWGMLQAGFGDEEGAKEFRPPSVRDDVLRDHAKAAKKVAHCRTEEVSKAADRVGPLHGNSPSIFFSSRAVAFVEVERQTGALAGVAERFCGVRAGQSVLQFGDIGGGPGAWCEALMFLVNQGAALPMRIPVGIAMTAKGRDDWKLEHLHRTAARPLPGDFAFYGADGGGEVSVSNVRAFASAVRKRTAGTGLHLLLGGGEAAVFRPRSARLLLASRVLGALLCLQEGGTAVLSVADITSEFAAGALYMLWYSFEELKCVVPRVSRPSAVPTCVVVCEGRRGQPRFQGPKFGQRCADAVGFLYQVVAALHKDSKVEVTALVDREVLLADKEFSEWYGDAVSRTLKWRTTTLRRSEAALGRSRLAAQHMGYTGDTLFDDRSPLEVQDQVTASRAFLRELDLPPPPVPAPGGPLYALGGKGPAGAGFKGGFGWGKGPWGGHVVPVHGPGGQRVFMKRPSTGEQPFPKRPTY